MAWPLARVQAHPTADCACGLSAPQLCLLLPAGGALAIALGPFADADSLPGLASGMTLVCAMAVQNAVHRIHLADSPPSTLMTGTTTQVMIDLANLLRGPGADRKAPIQARLARLSKSLAAFAPG